ncbi:HRDC-like protein [Hyaloraphidium curvatum]|nr:HRDC-like protein [Hyaloraphidium curvatum]
MEIDDVQAAFLSDYEVFDFLRELKESRDGKGRDKREKAKEKKDEDSGDLQSIDYQLRKYLAKRPCAQQSEQIILSFLEHMKEFKLTKLEKLQILNFRPTEQIDLYSIIENCEGRFVEEEVNRMLEIIQEQLPYTPPPP